MVWFLLLFFIIITLWVVSLCKVLHASRTAHTVGFLSNKTSEFVRRNILLVISHPDDESMFFSPTILYLTSKGHNLHILCMSTGNADGEGNIRKEEFYQACAILKVPLEQVKILDHPSLQDGFDKMWNHQLLAKIIGQETTTHGINLVVTFDNFGVSGHTNHCDVHHGICEIDSFTSWMSCKQHAFYEGVHREILKLGNLLGFPKQAFLNFFYISTNIGRKYSGPLDIWLSSLSSYNSRGRMCCVLNGRPYKSFSAMAQHRSQWVWFRKLFVVLSSYTYINTLRKISD